MTSSGQINKHNNQPDSEHRALPEGYGTTEAALLPRDPNWMFIYWEITDKSKAAIAQKYGQDIFEKASPVVRVYAMTREDGAPAEHKYFDVPVKLDAKNWYINVPDGGRGYSCEVGIVTPDGRFIGIVKTNTVTLPAGRVSEAMDEKWMSVTPDFEKLLQISGVEYIGKGSGEVAKSLAQRWEMLRSVFSRAASWGEHSVSQNPLQKPAEKKFWLVADCELVLYGATEPDAYVTVSGRKVGLNPDGTFSMRFALPDGKIDLPIKAVSRDEADIRRIEIAVTRNTTNEAK